MGISVAQPSKGGGRGGCGQRALSWGSKGSFPLSTSPGPPRDDAAHSPKHPELGASKATGQGWVCELCSANEASYLIYCCLPTLQPSGMVCGALGRAGCSAGLQAVPISWPNTPVPLADTSMQPGPGKYSRDFKPPRQQLARQTQFLTPDLFYQPLTAF